MSFKQKTMPFIQEKADYIISYGAVVLPRLIYVLFFVYPLRVTGDEIFLFYLPAKLAGLDWTPSMYSYRYYGYGFSILLVPLFKWIENPVLLYRICMVMVTLIEGTIPLICCYLLGNVFKMENKKLSVLIAVTCSYAVVLSVSYMYNEHIYTVGVWLSFLGMAQLLKYHDKSKRKLYYSIVLGLFFVFSLTIHQRAVTLLVGYVFVYIFMLIFHRKKIGYMSVVIPIYMVGSWINSKIVSWNIDFLKGSSHTVEVSEIENTSVSFYISKSIFTDKDYIRAVVRIIIGQLGTWDRKAGGLAIFTIILILCLLVKALVKESRESDSYTALFIIFGMCCSFISIAGQAVNWGWDVKTAYLTNNSSADILRGLVYARYLYAYFAPVLMAVLVYICKNPSVYLKLFKYNLIGSLTLSLVWLKDIVPFIKNNKSLVQPALSFTGFADTDVTAKQYFMAVFVLLFVALLIFLLFRNGKKRGAIIVMCVFTVYQYLFSMFYDKQIALVNYNHSDGSSYMIQKLRESDADCPIYVKRTSIPETGQGLLYQLQFMNMRSTLFLGVPEEHEGDVVIITIHPEEEKELSDNGYILYQIDDNEYAYVKGADVISFFEDVGKIAVVLQQ